MLWSLLALVPSWSVVDVLDSCGLVRSLACLAMCEPGVLVSLDRSLCMQVYLSSCAISCPLDILCLVSEVSGGEQVGEQSNFGQGPSWDETEPKRGVLSVCLHFLECRDFGAGQSLGLQGGYKERTLVSSTEYEKREYYISLPQG